MNIIHFNVHQNKCLTMKGERRDEHGYLTETEMETVFKGGAVSENVETKFVPICFYFQLL